MKAKKIIGKLHLWLGLVSGLLVFIIAITGSLYAFKDEILNLTEPFRFVEAQNKNFLPPSEIQKVADNALPGKHIHAVQYEGKAHAATVIYYSKKDNYYYYVYVNPYTGEVQKVKDMKSGFFPFILDGHFYLWLPHEIGQPVAATATLVFVVMMFSGLYLWWKRKKGSNGQRFKIKWNARWRRKNYDMHNVLGFYVTAIALVFAITGLVWGFEWFAYSYYKVATGGKEYIPYYDPASDTTAQVSYIDMPAIDKVWIKMIQEYPEAEAIEVHIPETTIASIAANANPDASTYWQTEFRYFDQYTLKELEVDHMYGKSANASAGEKLMRMNYDIHVGAILGLPGKMLAFFASLIVASLPVTGVLIWWGRKKKAKKQDSKVKRVAISKQALADLTSI